MPMYLVNLRMNGTARADHPIHKDLERVRSYVNKLKQAEGDLGKRGISSFEAKMTDV